MQESSWLPDPENDQTLEENWLFRLRRERFRSRTSGKAHDYYVLHLADAVNVIALTPDRRAVFVRQFRAGSGRDSLEIPGGLIDPGENACQAGARELLEETGYTGDLATLVGVAWANPSILAGRQFTVLITNAVRTREPNPDASEELAVELIPAVDIPEMIHTGIIDHALVVCGLLRWLVSELPGPLHQSTSRPSHRPNIATLVALVAIVAGALHLLFSMRDIVVLWLQSVWGAASIAAAIVLWCLVPPPSVTLVRASSATERRFFFLLLVSPLMLIVWFIALAGVAGWLLGILELLGLSWL